MSTPSALERIANLCSNAALTIFIFYRGEWCPFCTTWSRGLSNMRSLSPRLRHLNAQVIFVSSQPVAHETEAMHRFRFSKLKHERVHFVNDLLNEMAERMNERWGERVVVVDEVDGWMGGEVKFERGMLQPGVLCVEGLFGNKEHIVWRYGYDSAGSGGLIGEDDKRDLACTTLRRIEEALRDVGCS